jgi:putative tryptophan/tyrosine transport system substrate-binding protein
LPLSIILLALKGVKLRGSASHSQILRGSGHSGWASATSIGLRGAISGSNTGISAIDRDRHKGHLAELASLAPDVIVGNSTPVLAALRQATTNIPIVFVVVNDPVGQGFVSSLARPGGNITGFSFIEFSIVGKWIGMLKDVYPGLSRVALMFNPDCAPYYDVYLRSFERTPRSIAVEVRATPVRSSAEIERVIAQLGQKPGGGLIAASDPFIVVQREAILKSVKTHRRTPSFTRTTFFAMLKTARRMAKGFASVTHAAIPNIQSIRNPNQIRRC